jgi:sporadic carbohydrate cluster protein (TIGR04323 family)
MSATPLGYRGYVASRSVRGTNFPQQVQNLVLRDYAARNKLHYLLSSTEYAMPSCYLMLNAVLDEIEDLEGIIFFSAFMLPQRKSRRQEVFARILNAGRELHAAMENIVVRKQEDIANLEDLLDVDLTLSRLPLGGRYEKDEASMEQRGRDPFWSTLANDL